MEIPYIVNARKDTGLTNSKIAIWLFLASEVMLFGGFFSAYVYLRLGADYPWPERALPILPGLLNTFILIGSSVTVVFAWVALKLGNWRKFQIYMSITVACAAIFMVFKALEYNVKFHHQAVLIHDGTVLEGHLAYVKDAEKNYVKDASGAKMEDDKVRVVVEKLNFASLRFYAPWVNEMIDEANHAGAKITLVSDVSLVTEPGQAATLVAKAGEPLSLDLLNQLKSAHLKARTHNSALKTDALREEWENAKKESPEKKGWQLATEISVDSAKLAPQMLSDITNVEFKVSPPTRMFFKPGDIKEGAESSKLRDDTVVTGKMEESPMVMHHLDAIDFQRLVIKAEERGISPAAAIENSWLMKNSAFVREAWAWHLERNKKRQEVLNQRHGFNDDGTPKRTLTHLELYRLGWSDLGLKGVETKGVQIGGLDKLKEQFLGPNYKARGDKTFPHFSIPREQVRLSSKFTPKWNTYYAIYFTITGIHGLHVIGGAIVLLYYLLFGRKMFLENPEWLANRVEVGGLFWHFVDLVWIFAFPIFYLM